MQLFVRQKDLDLFNTIANELVDAIIETPVMLYKYAVHLMEDDLYGDSTNKVYYTPIELTALVEHQPEAVEHTEVGIDTDQKIVSHFQRDTLRAKDVYPETGDILQWNGNYYEITNINENYLVAGQHVVNNNSEQDTQNYNYTISAFATLSRQSKLNIEEFRAGNP